LAPVQYCQPCRPKPQPPPKPTTWTIYLKVVDAIRISLDDYEVATKQIRLGEIEAADEREAVEKAAAEFTQPPAKLVAVRRT
jgi:hypothetical protein